jgi:acetolactate synthase-1/2/3 large subunit
MTMEHRHPVPPAPRAELGDLLVHYLDQIGVEFIFGVPGGAIEPLYNALARSARSGGPRAVVARHECGAAYMADGYTRETGRLGVCCATTGPGATNLITGVASAYADKIPMLVITAQTALPYFGRGALQESSCTAVNTVGMFQHCTVYNTLVSHPDQLEGKLITAIMTAFQSPCGPAHISVPRDVLCAPWSGNNPISRLGTLLRTPNLVDPHAVEALCEQLTDAARVVILVGADCGDAIDAITRFAEVIGAEVVTTPQGKPWMDAYHPQYRGVFGFAGHASARRALLSEHTDLILAVGTDLDEFATSGWDRAALLNDKLIHVDETLTHFSRSPMARTHLYGRIKTVFEMLAQRAQQAQDLGRACVSIPAGDGAPPDAASTQLPEQERRNDSSRRCAPRHIELEDPAKYRHEGAPLKPQRLVCELTRLFPAETRFFADAGNSFVWTTHYLHTRQRGTYRVAMGFGAMAWAVGAAVGGALGCRGTPVVCITGDGSFLMSGQEITVAVQERLPVIYVVLNDRALGMVKHGQRLSGAEQTAIELPPVDFAAMGRAMGAAGYTITSLADLYDLDIEALCARPGPAILDVYIDGEEVPPMDMRVRTLNLQPGI